MRSVIFGSCLLIVSSTALQASDIDGLYSLDCSVPQDTFDGYLTVDGDQFRFHESTCTMKDPEPISGLEETLLYDATCSGEGEEWRQRFLVAKLFDGSLMTFQGTYGPAIFKRCN